MLAEENVEPVFALLAFIEADPEVADIEDPYIVPPDIATDESAIVLPGEVRENPVFALPAFVREDPEVSVIEDPDIVPLDIATDDPIIYSSDVVT